MRLVLTEDLTAAKLGLDYRLGLLHKAGDVLLNPLPEVEKKLLAEGLAVPESEWLKQQQQKKAAPPVNKSLKAGILNK